jgi:hypothetical protein
MGLRACWLRRSPLCLLDILCLGVAPIMFVLLYSYLLIVS